MVAPSDCLHGAPELKGEQKEEYTDGLKDLLKKVNKYMVKGSKKPGVKAAEKFRAEWPELVDGDMLALVSATGAKMLLKGDDRAKFVIQAVAEAIGTLEKEVKGYTTVKEAKVANLTRFYKHRLPCSCLNKTKEKKVEKMGQCTFEGCGEMKPMVRLSACAGCQVATYCCVDCQRNDWPDHGKVCQTLANQKKEDLSEREEESTSNDVSETSAKEEDEEEAEEVVEEAPKKKDKKKKTEEKKKSEATGTEDKEKKKSKKKKKKAEA